mmetsp:Transcript_56894/g.123092  ORF Transcript_56894/g.123092 Transcript_56894/m.123092 type:complete len:233 (+) Transcript_56894:1157-1855(+)
MVLDLLQHVVCKDFVLKLAVVDILRLAATERRIQQVLRWAPRKRRVPIELPEIPHMHVSAFGLVLHRPVVIGVREIVQRSVIAATSWSVVWSGHPSIPFASKVCAVTPSPQYLRHTRHGSRYAIEATDGVCRVVCVQWRVQDIHVDGCPSALNGGTGRSAHVVYVHVAQLHAVLCKPVDRWGLHFIRRNSILLPEVSHIRPTQIIYEDEHDVRLLGPALLEFALDHAGIFLD